MKKKFRIVKNDLSEEGQKAYHPYWYRIEQRHSILFGLIKWWISPEFAPPHNFESVDEALKYILDQCPKAIVTVPEEKGEFIGCVSCKFQDECNSSQFGLGCDRGEQ